MAFLSRSARKVEFGSGGKILRGRRYRPQFSPYTRPTSPAAPLALMAPEPEAGGNPSWLRGIISGAGKLISSVLGSEESGSPSECSSDYSSEEEYDPLPNEYSDQLLSDELTGFDKRERVGRNAESLAIVSKNESKLVIEQLLMQENFTRDEYSKFVEILRSRVLDIPTAKGGEVIQEEVPERVSEKYPWQSLNQSWNISGSSNVSPSNLSSFSPKYYASEAVTPDLRNRAVMEAKKWFVEKKLSPGTICDRECGPCVLNTDMNQYCFDSDSGSPIEMAKSYMQSLPPWRSPSFSTTSFRNPPSSGNITSCSIGSHSLLSSKVERMGNSAIGPLQYSRVYKKLKGDERGSSKLKQAGSATESPLFNVSKISTATTKSGIEVRDEPLKLNDRNDADGVHVLDMHKEISQGSILELQDVFKEAQETPKIASEKFIDQLHSDIDSILPTSVDIFMSDKEQDLEMPLANEAPIDSVYAPHDSIAFSKADVNDVVSEGSFIETDDTLQPEIAIPAAQSIQKTKDDAVQENPDSNFKHTYSFTDSQQSDANPNIPTETSRPAEETDTNGHSVEINNTNSSLGPTSNSEGTRQPLGDVSDEVPSIETKSMEQIRPKPSETGKDRRRAKKVVRQKGWKG